MEQKNKHDIKLGIFIFVGLLFFIIGVLAIGNINKSFTKTISITTVFDEVSGLQPGDNVWFSGVKVGTVKSLQFLTNASVEVTMKIESKSKEFVPKNAMAKISSDGLIGNKIIVIYGGTPNSGHIETGDTLLYESTYSTEDMISMLQENNKNVLAITSDFKKISAQMANGEGTIGRLLTEDSIYMVMHRSLDHLNQAAVNTDRVTGALITFSDKLNTEGYLVNDIAEDTVLFNRLSRSVEELNSITGAVLASANNLQLTTSDLNKNTETPVGVLLHDAATAESMKASIHNLENSTAKLNESMTALQHNFLFRRYFKNKSEAVGDTLH